MNFDGVKFDQAVNILSPGVKSKLTALGPVEKNDTYEIRLRTGKPIILWGKYGVAFLDKDKGINLMNNDNAYVCKPEIITETFNRLCCYSVYSHLESIVKGYITYQGGHRAGIAGTACVDSEGRVTSINDISCINIRIAREIKGAADEVIKRVFSTSLKSTVIVGPPTSGKTTLLRDLVRQLSDKLYKISVIDEREEIAAMNGAIPQNDVGINTDVLSAYPKKTGIMNALKTMSPDVIAVDEVGQDDEIEGIKLGLSSGVRFIVTLHASSYEDMLSRPQLKKLLSTGSFENVVLLKSGSSPCKVEDIFDAKELYDEICRSSTSLDKLYTYRDSNIIIA